MRKLWILLLGGVLMACTSYAEETVVQKNIIQDDQIYFFTMDGCPHCEDAKGYLKRNYPDLKIKEREISDSKNRKYFYACGAKFGLKRYQLGTPLFCMGDHYILGWGWGDDARFDKYIQPFLAEDDQGM